MAHIRIPVPNPVEYLINLRFPAYRALQASMGSGRTFEERQAIEERVEQYRQELMGKPEADIGALFAEAQAQAPAKDERRMKLEQEERAYFYNRPDAMADFGFWSSAVYWSPEEGTALVLGRCPEKVNWENLKIYLSTPFAKRYGNLRNLVARASAAGMLTKEIPPGVFIAFAERSGFPPPPELVAALQEKGVQLADWKTLHDVANANAERLAQEVVRLTEEVAQANLTRAELEQQVQELNAKLSAWEFQPESPTYPRELDAAFMAWWAVINLPAIPSNPGEAVEHWLATYQPPPPDATPFSKEARRRIARVCNWNKLGGRAREKPKGRWVKTK